MIRLLASRRRAAVLVVVGACAGAGVEEPSPVPLEGSSTTTEEARLPIVAEPPPEPVVLPLRALLAGLLPFEVSEPMSFEPASQPTTAAGW